jgi:predicted transcriptional regulator of viral defense system
MKSSANLLEGMKLMPYLSKDSVQQLGTQLDLNEGTINSYISRYLKRRQLHKLKRGFYVSADFLERHGLETSYVFYLANVLRTPSYVSSWTALQYYDLTTEVILTITSVTPKITRTYQTKAGTFIYQSINKELFTDFSLVKGTFEFFIASPSKALFDLLYFRTHQFRGTSRDKVMGLIEELRIDFDEMDNAEQKKFHASLTPYIHE